MSEQVVGHAHISEQANGKSTLEGLEWPRFAPLERAEETLPPLHFPGARPIARDRWERLVTSIDIPAAGAKIWQALTDPAALKQWFAVCHGSLEELQRDCTLDFEDGEFFFCRPIKVDSPNQLQYLWRWLGISQATLVTWNLEDVQDSTRVTVIEEAFNPPWDWQTWNGGGWPGILNQLAAYLRTGTKWRWPWRRMGPYAQVELSMPFYEVWEQLFSSGGLRYWLQVMNGSLLPDQSLTILMGDASGMVEMSVREIVQPGQLPPSFLPHMDFSLTRQVWNSEIQGRIWLEPAGWGRSLLQVVHYNWENLPPALQLSERKILTSFWAGAVQRASLMCGRGLQQASIGPHSWS